MSLSPSSSLGKRLFHLRWLALILLTIAREKGSCGMHISAIVYPVGWSGVILWFIIRNIFLDFVHCSWHRALKTLGIFWVMKIDKGVFTYVNEMTFGFILGWGLVARRTNHVIKRLELSVPPHWILGWGMGLRVEPITNGQWFDQSCLCNEASIKLQKDRVWRVSKSVHMWRLGIVMPLERAWKLHAPFPYLASCVSSIWLFLSYILL